MDGYGFADFSPVSEVNAGSLGLRSSFKGFPSERPRACLETFALYSKKDASHIVKCLADV